LAEHTPNLFSWCDPYQLDFWEKVPNYLKIQTAPDEPLYRLQAHLLRCRYNNTRIMLYRPFLFHVRAFVFSTSLPETAS
jgi:hypothetical protein